MYIKNDPKKRNNATEYLRGNDCKYCSNLLLRAAIITKCKLKFSVINLSRSRSFEVEIINKIMATVLPGIIMLGCSYIDSGVFAVFFMSISICLCGLQPGGFQSMFIEISPTLSNVIYGISNSIGTIPGIIAPIFSGYILGESPGNSEWKILFYVALGMHLFGIIVFCSFGTVQRISALNK